MTLTARAFIARLNEFSSDANDNSKFFAGAEKKNMSIGVKMGSIFSMAKEFMNISLGEIEKLLDSNYYEARMGAVSIMDYRARDKKTSEAEKKALYDLYMLRHDRINNWDLVDRSAPYVVGGYLYDKARTPLYRLAKSKDVWERRTSIVSTYFFIRQDEIEDTFRIAALLVKDKDHFIHMAVGGWIREAGKRDKKRLLQFLDEYADVMAPVMLRYAVEKFDKAEKEVYLQRRKKVT